MSRKRKTPSRRREVKPMPKLTIRVEPDGWGHPSLSAIGSLLQNAASHINGHLRKSVIAPISVRWSDDGPITLIQESTQELYKVTLSARSAYWGQYVYQFAHEFCHVMINPFVPRRGSNAWIEETFCELASVYVLRRMAGQWKTSPPMGHYSGFAPSLAKYAQDRLSDPQRSLPAETDLLAWRSANEPALRHGPDFGTMEQWDARQRNRMAVMAYGLLPLFEEHPASAWNAVRRLPVDGDPAALNMPTSDYLQYWRSVVDERDTPAVELVMSALCG